MDARDPRHGTDPGYQQHLLSGTPTCQPCRTAHTLARRQERDHREPTRQCACGTRINAREHDKCSKCRKVDARERRAAEAVSTLKPRPREDPAAPCPTCGKTLLGCRLNKRLNRGMWLVVHKARPSGEVR